MIREELLVFRHFIPQGGADEPLCRARAEVPRPRKSLKNRFQSLLASSSKDRALRPAESPG